MRLTSTGLGIGTSSPADKLEVASSTTNTGITIYNNNGSGGLNARLGFKSLNGYDASSILAAVTAVPNASGNTATSLVFSTSGDNNIASAGLTERMRLDSSGNLGLGVTPSAWAASQNAFQIGNAGAINSSNSSQVILSANRYYANSGDTYINTAFASLYQQVSGQHQFYTAPSGTAGNAITFTQAMTLDASGNLLVGTTTAVERLTVGSGTSTASGINLRTTQTDFSIQPSNSAAGGVTIGVSFVAGGQGPMIFSVGGEKARIDSSGNLLVGTTTLSNRLSVVATSGQYVARFGLNGTGSQSFINFVIGEDTTPTGVGSVTTNGTTTSYNTTSDQRLKENIVDAPEFGSVIDSIKVRSYDWKSDGSHQRAGFIAQELVTVAPEAVHQPTDTEEMMAVDYSKLVPMLVKEIQSLRKRLADAGL